MKDILYDILAHTYGLGFIDAVKVTGTTKETLIEAAEEQRTVVVSAKTLKPVTEFVGVFGMPNLQKLDTLLKIPVYKEDGQITLQTQNKDNETIPVGLHFENSTKDFQNDYRFMSSAVVNEKLKSFKFKKNIVWDVVVKPSVKSIARFGYQAQVNTDEAVFKVTTKNGNLVFSFGDHSTHAGEFVFEENVTGKLTSQWMWPILQVQKILALVGETTMHISNAGALQITVNSGLCEYNYILPAMSK